MGPEPTRIDVAEGRSLVRKVDARDGAQLVTLAYESPGARGQLTETQMRYDRSLPDQAPLIANRYRLIDSIGYGGMASVWRAHDELSGRDVAVKLIGPHLATDELGVRRFKREAAISQRLRHPNIVAGLDAGYDETLRRHYIVMELVDGDDAALLRRHRGTLPVAEVVGIVAQVCDALAHAHRHGVVHGDVSPGNVLVSRSDRIVKLADFGLARTRWMAGAGVRTRPAGTPRYLAPEVADGWPATPLSDVYSLGAVAHRLIASDSDQGRPTFQTAVPLGAAAGPLDPLPADVPAAVAHAIAKATATDPADRHTSALDFRAALITPRLACAA